MCLIVFAWRPEHATPLIVAANRDEFYARPTLPLAAWEEYPGVYAGRDLEAGGTWMGVAAGGRFAALTNVRDPGQPIGPRSRGELVAAFLQGRQSPLEYLQQVARRASDYSGFNLLVGDSAQLCYFNPRVGAPVAVAPGVHGLSNAALDTPWPKLLTAREGLEAALEKPDTGSLVALLTDNRQPNEAELPDTGVGLATERLLSSVFIASPNYGTRASTALIVHADGRRELLEHSFGPSGARLGEVSLIV
ncbi:MULTISPECIES: NRDE family protein [Pseudomonas]|uniref:NRDE family protein n=1 Tax=Pseudomonas nitroreducens TaxID=46680 RepID=UPI001E53CDF7|nr:MULTISPECIES: NRDE family protein [Pseudomonas]MCE4069043.1 NRDE family protein [Pseudomonas nitritireducens]MCE4078232.1 NRDE family protein [Pseudomonas nitroreducens]